MATGTVAGSRKLLKKLEQNFEKGDFYCCLSVFIRRIIVSFM